MNLQLLSIFAAERLDELPFLMPGATVVLLAGLPGDIESENAYREQMQGLLESIADAGNVRKVISLSDFNEALHRPDKLDITFLKADRSTFQNLGTTLSGATNPVVIIAWGHGGKQGYAPVFHVRGPRITPADIQALAGKLPTASRWVLLFRGSGSFASQLAGPGRAILSSESETMFNSDPISIQLLVKILRADPRLAMGKLSEKLGQASAAWYSERNLAATEEPTLWLDQDKPRLLAGSGRNPLVPDKPSENKSAPDIPKQPPAELPAVWKEIKREEASKYPGEDALVLKRRVRCTLGSSPAISTEQEEFIQVFTLEGKRFGDFDISYTPPYEDIHFLECEVLRPDGTIARLDPDAIQEERQDSIADYQSGRRKFFSLPGVVPGSILHVRHRSEWQTFPLPHTSMEIPIGRGLAALSVAIEITVPKDSAFHFGLEKIDTVDPTIKQGGYGTTYSWKFENVPTPVQEPLSPPRQHPRLLLSTFPGWTEFASWYGRICKLTDATSPELTAKAAELTAQSKTDRDKVIAVYNYVTGLRYVAVPLGVNSFRPHAATNVFQNQFGDCKDKANLFNALLRALNIDAYLVLLPRFSQAYDHLPGLAFNHAISQVRLEGKTVWVDTTDDVCRFGLLPPGDPGRKVLVIDGSTNLVELPLPVVGEHQLKIKALIDCTKPQEPLPIRFEAKTTGYADYELRNAAQENSHVAASFPLLSRILHPLSGVFALERQNGTRVSALEENFSCQAEGAWIGGVSANARQSLLRSPFWIPNQWNLALHHRKNPLFLNEGYPLMIEEEFVFTLPPESRVDLLPRARQNKEGPLRWKSEWTKEPENKLTARFHAELESGELSAAATLEFQRQLRILFATLSDGAIFSTSP
jgi:transglutaminase-like putative cysteine protease